VSKSNSHRHQRPDSNIVGLLVGCTVEQIERELILCTLAEHGGCRTRTASTLGVCVRTLRNKINEYQAAGVVVPAPEPSGCGAAT
jgi:two-component system response regulator FlrC